MWLIVLDEASAVEVWSYLQDLVVHLGLCFFPLLDLFVEVILVLTAELFVQINLHLEFGLVFLERHGFPPGLFDFLGWLELWWFEA